MADLAITYDNLKGGDPIIAAQLKTNFAEIVGYVNGSITTANLAANAGIVDTQLATIETPGKVSGDAILTGSIAIGAMSAVLDKITCALLIDGSGSPIIAGAANGCIPVPFTGTITNVKVFSDTATTAVLDLWKDTYANYPPTVADTITASAKPTLTTAAKYTDSTLTGWTTSVTAGDIIKINVDSNDLATWMVVSITFTRTA